MPCAVCVQVHFWRWWMPHATLLHALSSLSVVQCSATSICAVNVFLFHVWFFDALHIHTFTALHQPPKWIWLSCCNGRRNESHNIEAPTTTTTISAICTPRYRIRRSTVYSHTLGINTNTKNYYYSEYYKIRVRVIAHTQFVLCVNFFVRHHRVFPGPIERRYC